MLCFICALSGELIVILSLMKRAQTDSRDCSFVPANQHLRVGCLPQYSPGHDQALQSPCLISLPNFQQIMCIYMAQTLRSCWALLQFKQSKVCRYTIKMYMCLPNSVFHAQVQLMRNIHFGFLITCKHADLSKFIQHSSSLYSSLSSGQELAYLHVVADGLLHL